MQAIGLFMSSLTGYQIVALSARSLFFPRWTTFVHYGRGLICKKSDLFSFYIGPYQSPAYRSYRNKDVIYFITITVLFIVFYHHQITVGQVNTLIPVLAGKYLGAFVLSLTIGYISSLPSFTGYFDATATQKIHFLLIRKKL